MVREYYRCQIKAESFEEAKELFNNGENDYQDLLDSQVREVELDIEESILRNKDIIDDNEMKELKKRYKL